MALSTIQPGQIHQQVDYAGAPFIHAATQRAVRGGNLLDKPTFGQMFLGGFLKIVSPLLKLGAGFAQIFGPLGAAASSGMYQLGGLMDRVKARSDNNNLINLRAERDASRMRSTRFNPGLGTTTEMDRLDTVGKRETAALDQINKL